MIIPTIILFDGEGPFFYKNTFDAESSLEWLDVMDNSGSGKFRYKAFDSMGAEYDFKCKDIIGKILWMNTTAKGVELVKKSEPPNPEMLRELLIQWLKDEKVSVRDCKIIND